MLRKIVLWVLCTLLVISEGFGQNSSSTYSALGIGEFSYGGQIQNQGMGGLGISFGTGWSANAVNPALSTRNTIFNFQASLNYKRIGVKNDTENSLVDGGGLSYLAISLPVKTGKFTAGMGIGQISSINYRLKVDSPVNNSDLKAENNLEGDGGISEAYVNFGYLIAKNLSFGAHGSYLFGSSIRSNQLLIFDQSQVEVGRASEYYERISVSDVALKLGAHYFFKTSEKSNLHLGAIYQTFGNVNGIAFAKLAPIGQANSVKTDGDFIANNERGTIYLPNRYGFGVSYEKNNKFVIGLEGQYQDFSEYRNFFGESLSLQAAQKVGLGFQIVPDFMDFDKLLNRATYRMGLEWMRTPYFINETTINDIGINFGTSIPVNQLSLLNMAMKVGRRGTVDNGLIREAYVNFTLGFSLNDNSWFYKRVFE
ncbi:MAG: hypothetical protein O2829_02860 [Bacteroidetes bacterium]|nr:hypothetical protein [Bacteroidota bacterium]MDA1268012.1 hypothetical protein [Bacteroidota bacterium]